MFLRDRSKCQRPENRRRQLDGENSRRAGFAANAAGALTVSLAGRGVAKAGDDEGIGSVVAVALVLESGSGGHGVMTDC